MTRLLGRSLASYRQADGSYRRCVEHFILSPALVFWRTWLPA